MSRVVFYVFTPASRFPELSLIKRLKRKEPKHKKQTNKQKQQQQKLLLNKISFHFYFNNWLVKRNNGASSLFIFILLENFPYHLFQPTVGNHAINLTRTFSIFLFLKNTLAHEFISLLMEIASLHSIKL